MKKLTTIEFIQLAKKTHGDLYEYDISNYINSRTEIKVNCKKHGVFKQLPKVHTNGGHCQKCIKEKRAIERLLTNEQFISKSNMIHQNKYDYSLTYYKSYRDKVSITCKLHGKFKQLAANHLMGHGCKECAISDNVKLHISNTDEFIEKSKKIHHLKYDYSFVNYIKSQKKVKILCKIHGFFYQSPNSHLSGNGCAKCSNKAKITLADFIKRAKDIHGKKYNYDRIINIKNSSDKLNILCPEHGFFKQGADGHLNQKQGCPQCNESKGERIIANFLNKNKIKFIRQKIFKKCINPKTQRNLKFDFYLSKYNICIEYDGQQHFRPVKRYGGNEGFEKIKERDEIKNEFCNRNHIQLYRIKFNESIYKKLNQLCRNLDSTQIVKIP